MAFGDFNGDGRSDQVSIDALGRISISLSDGVRLLSAEQWFEDAPAAAMWLVGDFDGDDRSDLLAIDRETAVITILLGREHSFTVAAGWTYTADALASPLPEIGLEVGQAITAPALAAPSLADHPVVVGDFDGDGRSDVLIARADGDGVDALLSRGSGFVRTAWSDTSPSDLADWQVGDFDDDGKDDVLRTSPNGVEVLRSTGQDFAASALWTGAGLVGGTRWTVGDFDGDGKDDIYRYNPFALDGDVFLSNGQSFYAAGNWSPLSRMSVSQLATLDLDGDGWADLSIGNGAILANTGFDFSVRKIEEGEDPTTVRIPKVMVAGEAFTLEVDRGGRYDCTVYDPSTGVVLVYIDALDPTTRITLGDEFQPGRFYAIRLNAIGDASVSMTSSFKLISREAANEASHLLDRFDVEYLGNEARPFFDDDAWKTTVHSFAELSDRFDALFDARTKSIDDGTSRDLAKALFLMQCVNQMWGYGNPIEATLPGRVIQNEAFTITSNDDVVFDLYLNSTIADCQDFAALTAFVLTRSGIENRVVLTTGHVFNEAFVDGHWIVLDSTLGISYDHSYAEVLDSSIETKLLDFGRASAVQDSSRYRDLISDFYTRKIMFDAAGISSDPTIMSVADFYAYIPDGFIYRDALGDRDLPTAFDPVSIGDSYFPEALDFDDFYNQVALFDRFEVAYASAPSRAEVRFDDPDALAYALRAAADATPAGDALDRVTLLAGVARAQWDIEEHGTTALVAVLGTAYAEEGFAVRIVSSKNVDFLELVRDGEAFVFDPALGIIYSGDFGDLLRAGRIPATVLAARDGDVDAIAPLSTNGALIDNFLKLQLGYYADYTAVALSGWHFGSDDDDTLIGDAGNDIVHGGAGRDRLYGGDGDDWLYGGAQGDVLIGGRGNDALEGGDDDDYLSGGDGVDMLKDDAGDDQLFGGAGNDRLAGGAGLNWLDGGDGDDVLDGGDDPDILLGGSGADAAHGSRGNDYLNGGEDADTLFGGDGDDQLFGEAGEDQLSGGDGIDRLDGGLGNDVLNGDAGRDVLIGRAGDDALHGGDEDDYLNGGDGRDALNGDGGNDQLFGGADNDRLEGRLGLDWLDGGDGDDALFGGDDADILLGGMGVDEGHGGSDNDYLNGGAGDDMLEGDEGDDQLFGDEGADALSGSDGIDWLDGGAGNDVLLGGMGGDVLLGRDGSDQLEGGYGDDYLHGGAGTDNLLGGAGIDVLVGGDGDDQILGGDGDDYILGGAGDDLLTGGSGADTFVFLAGEGSDVVQDFGADDRIRLPGFGFRDFADLLEHSRQCEGDVIIDVGGGDTLTLLGVSLEQLQADASFLI
jgi:Ca2+-binding RTX toxin-like protein